MRVRRQKVQLERNGRCASCNYEATPTTGTLYRWGEFTVVHPIMLQCPRCCEKTFFPTVELLEQLLEEMQPIVVGTNEVIFVPKNPLLRWWRWLNHSHYAPYAYVGLAINTTL